MAPSASTEAASADTAAIRMVLTPKTERSYRRRTLLPSLNRAVPFAFRSRSAGRIAAIAGAAVVLVLILSQLFLPGIGEGVIEDRLTENGGAADASLSATPAARLLWGSGDKIAVDATGLDLEVTTSDDPVVFDDLDRFDDVEIVIRDSSMGPVQMSNFVLTRNGDEPYSLEATGRHFGLRPRRVRGRDLRPAGRRSPGRDPRASPRAGPRSTSTST